jgi:predicted DCC family thiol-disulfide oxidoreductase YuxK
MTFMSTDTKVDPSGTYVLFDGVCNVCNYWVQFIIKRDPNAHFRFASLQSTEAQQLLEKHNQTATLDSIVLLQNGKVYTESTAILQITKKLTGLWKVMSAFRIVPKFLRDGVYRWFAKNRYRWFGQQESCMIPTPDVRQRFLS